MQTRLFEHGLQMIILTAIVFVGSTIADEPNTAITKTSKTITIWMIGRPNQENLPDAKLPNDLKDLIQELGFKTNVSALNANEFPIKIREAGKNGNEPDIVAGRNYLPFREVMAQKEIKLIPTKGVLNRIAPFAFLVKGSPNSNEAIQVALANVGVEDRFSWSLQEPKFNDPIQTIGKKTRLQIVQRFRRAVTSYLTNDKALMNSVSHEKMLPTNVEFVRGETLVGQIRSRYITGNERFLAVYGAVSFQSESFIGCTSLLTIWIKNDNWKLLTITNDPVSLRAAKKLPILFAELNNEPGPPAKPVELVSPPDGDYPQPANGNRFGDFVWRSNDTQDTSIKIAEFHYGTASRLFVQPDERISAGSLWTTGGEWAWRVWSISKNGSFSVSDDRNFSH